MGIVLDVGLVISDQTRKSKLMLWSLPPSSNPETMSSVSIIQSGLSPQQDISGSLLKIAITSHIVIVQCTPKLR